MASTPFTTSLDAALVARGLEDPQGYTHLYQITNRRYGFTGLIGYLNRNTESIQVQGVEGKIYSMIQNPTNVYGQIASSTGTTTQLVLTLTDSAYNEFRTNWIVQDNLTGKQAYVSAHSAGSVTLVPSDGGTFTVGTHFAANNYVISMSNNSSDYNSGTTEKIYYAPQSQVNYLKIARDSSAFARRNFDKSFVDRAWKGARPAMMLNQEFQMVQTFSRDMEKDFMYGLAVETYLPNGDRAHQNGGLAWAIANREGGISVAASSAVSFDDDIKPALVQIRELTNRAKQEIVIIAGANARQRIVDQLQPYKLTAGTNSVLQGKGLDVEVIDTTFATLSFVDSIILNDPTVYPQISSITGTRIKSEEIFMIPIAQIEVNGGELAPPIRKCYFNFDGVKMYTKQGLVDSNGNPLSTTFSEEDGFTSGLIRDNGIDIPAPIGFYHRYLTA